MGYLGNHLATVVVSAFAAILTGFYFVTPLEAQFLMLIAVVVTWFLAFICWIAQKSADYVHGHSHSEKKSSTSLAESHTTQTTVVADLAKLRDSFTAELDEIKDEVRLKDDEIGKLRQQISNLETRVQIEELKVELANLKALAAKEKSPRKKKD
ncbi:MAG: hypothetical protein ACT4NT_04800 [Nitrososphaerota archaeon]